MTLGLPATSPDEQEASGHPLTVTVPVYVPGAIKGGKGLMAMLPLVWPVMENDGENSVPVTEVIATNTVPPLIDTPTFWAEGVAPLWIAVKVMLVVDTESAGPLLPPPSPLPPPQAASNSTRPANRPRSTQGARLIKLSPFCFGDGWQQHPAISLLLLVRVFGKSRLLKDGHTTGNVSQRIAPVEMQRHRFEMQ
jgi:hypothetical protein